MSLNFCSRTTPLNRTTGGVFIYNTMKGGHFHPASLRTGIFHATKQMADDKKNIPEAASPAEAPAPTAKNAAVPEQLAPEPVLTDAEVVMLEHEGQAALFEMGDAMPDPADTVTLAEVEEPAAPEGPKVEKEQAQPPDPGEDNPTPAYSG